MPGRRERWLTSRCAAEAGIAPATWRDYTKKIRDCPQPIRDEFGPRGERKFFADEVRAFLANRPGRGAPGRPRQSRTR